MPGLTKERYEQLLHEAGLNEQNVIDDVNKNLDKHKGLIKIADEKQNDFNKLYFPWVISATTEHATPIMAGSPVSRR